ncbi:ABC transporter ATP-binding protein, partial [Micromonospora sp. ANENR4]|nr:ABC transporter ATP-binding protein [Micromonospora sp. ANENR4]
CRWADVNGDRSRTEVPELGPAGTAGHLVACHLSAGDRERIYRDEVAQVGVAR